MVWAYDEETGESDWKPVVRLFRNESKDWTIVKINGEEIESTPGHKYYLPEKKAWKSASLLKKGDKVLLSSGGYAIIEFVKSKHYDKPQTTYNFEVKDFHTYFVGIGVCVHNRNCGIPELYRGGNKMKVRSRDVEIVDDLVQPTRGVSVNSNPGAVANFGGAYKIGDLPNGLTIKFTGGTHYEIIPQYAMPLEKYQALLNQISLIPFGG